MHSQQIIRESILGIKTLQNADSILEALQVPKLTSKQLRKLDLIIQSFNKSFMNARLLISLHINLIRDRNQGFIQYPNLPQLTLLKSFASTYLTI